MLTITKAGIIMDTSSSRHQGSVAEVEGREWKPRPLDWGVERAEWDSYRLRCRHCGYDKGSHRAFDLACPVARGRRKMVEGCEFGEGRFEAKEVKGVLVEEVEEVKL